MELDRRLFIATMLGALSGCGRGPESVTIPRDLDLGVDAHIHLFNGTDVPVEGFVKEVIYGDHAQDLPSGLPPESLALLAIKILRSWAPTARREIEGLPPRGRESDRIAVERGFDDFIAAMPQGPTSRMARAGGARNDALLLQMIREDAGGPQVSARMAAPQPQMTGRDYAALIYPDEGTPTMEARRSAGESPIFAMIKWAGLLTRRRSDLLDEVIRLYANPGGRPEGGGGHKLDALIAAMVDLEYWIGTDEDVAKMSPLSDQLEVMGRLARRRNDVLLLNFAPFCPLRAVVEGGARAMQLLEYAVMDQGFAGVKLYPPMGFRPTCNDGISFGHTRVKTGVTGAMIDAELDKLYAWCVENEVPVQAHANNSMAAAAGTGGYASPEYWGLVLDRFPDLRLNLSHAGIIGGERQVTPPVAECITGHDYWGDVVANMTQNRAQVYFDTGYWDEIGVTHTDVATIKARLQRYDATYPNFRARMMYGSDWTMIARLPGYQNYLNNMLRFVDDLFPDTGARNGVMGANALNFVLGPGQKQARRLNRVFGQHPVWRRISAARRGTG